MYFNILQKRISQQDRTVWQERPENVIRVEDSIRSYKGMLLLKQQKMTAQTATELSNEAELYTEAEQIQCNQSPDNTPQESPEYVDLHSSL